MKAKLPSLLLRHEFVLLVVLLIELVYFNSVGRRFGTADNMHDILRHSVEIGLLAVAMTPVILAGGIDLSVGSMLGLCAIVFGQLSQEAGLPHLIAAAGAIATGGCAGALNGLLVTRFRLPPLIVTLGTFSLFRGLAEAMTEATKTYTGFSNSFLALGQQRLWNLPTQVWIFIAIASAIWLLTHRTVLGRSWRAIGFASEGARYAGIPVESRVRLTYIIVGLVAGLAGVIYTARLGQAKADAGTGYELYAITAAVLGGTSIFGGTGSVHGTLLGVATIAVLSNGLVHARQPREMAGIFTGTLLVLALTASALAARRGEKR